MSVDYSIAAIPTEYRGRRYRSRLEARWAAFFDLLEWTAEYEPFDLGKWSPDFLLHLRRNVLVEVKPVTEPCEATLHKMFDACNVSGMWKMPVSVALLLGVAPAVIEGRVRLGWGVFDTGDCAEAFLVWDPSRDGQPKFTPRIGGDSDGGSATIPSDGWPSFFYPDHGLHLWSKATSEVQWQPDSGR